MITRHKDHWRYSRLTFLLMSLVLCAFWLTGCGSVQPIPNPVTQSATSDIAEANAADIVTPVTISLGTVTPRPTSSLRVTEEQLKGITVKFWYSMPEAQIASIIYEFNARNKWSIHVEGVPFSAVNELSQSVVASVNSAQAPQVALAYGDQVLAWDQQVGLADLAVYINDPLWGVNADEQADFIPVFWDEGLQDKRRIALPALATAQFLFYNQTWAQELGFASYPLSTQEFETQACAANQYQKQDDTTANDYSGGWIVNTEPEVITSWIYAFGGDLLAPDRSTYRFDTYETKEAFTFLKKLYDKNCAWVSQNMYPDDDFAGRLGLFASGSLADLPYQEKAFQQVGNSDQWTVLPFPSPIGEPVITTRLLSLAMLAGDEAQEVAGWLFMRWMLSSAVQAQWSALTGYFPVRASASVLMTDYKSANPRWTAGLNLLTYAHHLPRLSSWGDVQWVVKDAGTQIFRSYFQLDRLGNMLKEMDRTAAELSARSP